MFFLENGVLCVPLFMWPCLCLRITVFVPPDRCFLGVSLTKIRASKFTPVTSLKLHDKKY